MATNRTISESKDDLKAAAVAINKFRKTFLKEPTEIAKSELPLFSVLDGVDSGDEQEIDPFEIEYDVRYSFDIVMVLAEDCLESEVISVRNAWVTKLQATAKTNKTIPFRLVTWRHYRSHWGNVAGWFVTMTLSRYTIEDFSS